MNCFDTHLSWMQNKGEFLAPIDTAMSKLINHISNTNKVEIDLPNVKQVLYSNWYPDLGARQRLLTS